MIWELYKDKDDIFIKKSANFMPSEVHLNTFDQMVPLTKKDNELIIDFIALGPCRIS